MSDEIDLLKKQLAFAHERIERITRENWEIRILLRALIFSGENAEILIKEIHNQKELFVSSGLAHPISDADIDYLEKAANQVVSILRARIGGHE